MVPLPTGFTAHADAFKRLKPATVQRPERTFTKSDRRHEGQRRQNRNAGQQRHPQRVEGHPAHRSNAQDGNGQRRDDRSTQRNEGARGPVRSPYRPEALREAPSEQRVTARPDGGQPKRKFHDRPRRPGGGPRRAHG